MAAMDTVDLGLLLSLASPHRMRRPPVIGTTEEVKEKLALLEVGLLMEIGFPFYSFSSCHPPLESVCGHLLYISWSCIHHQAVVYLCVSC